MTISSVRRRRPGPGWVATRTFVRAAESIGKARAWVRARLRAARVEPDVIDVTELLVSEVATNAVRHGDGDEITVRLELAEHLEAAVHDDARRGTPTLRRAAPADLGGRGLTLVQGLSSAWGTRQDGTGKWVWFRLPRASAPAAAPHDPPPSS